MCSTRVHIQNTCLSVCSRAAVSEAGVCIGNTHPGPVYPSSVLSLLYVIL